MRITVKGTCDSAVQLRGLLIASGYLVQEKGNYTIHLFQSHGGEYPVVVDGIDCEFEREVLAQLHKQGVPAVAIIFKDGIQSDREIRVGICDPRYQVAVELALLNAILKHTGKVEHDRKTKSWWRRLLFTPLLLLVGLAGRADAQFVTTVQFWDGLHVIKAGDNTNNALRVLCVGGTCGGASPFADDSVFTAGASGISITAGVFNDGLAAVTSGNAAAPRITAQRAFHINLRNNAGAETGVAATPLRIDPTGSTTQPISAASLPLPTGAALEATLGTRLAEATFTTRINTQGQKAMAASTPVVIASDQSAVATSITAGNFPDNESFNVAQWGGSATTLGQKASSASVPVVLPTDYYLPTKSATGTLTGTTCTGNPGSGNGCFTMAMDGVTSVGLTLNGGGTGVLTYLVEFSGDGVVYSTTYMWSWLTSIKYLSRTLPNPNVAEQFSLLVGDGAKYVRIRASAFTSGSSSFTITANNTPFPVWYQSGIGGLAPVAGITVQGVDGAGLAQYPRVTDDLTVSATLNGNVLMSEKGARWSVTSNPAVSTQATASKAAGAAGVKHVADCITYSASAGVAPAATLLSINLRDGATGAGTVLASWRMFVPAAIGQMDSLGFCGLNIPGTAATAMTLEFSALLTSLNESVTLTGYSVQ